MIWVHWVQGVFLSYSIESNTVELDVTNLMPNLGGSDHVKYMAPYAQNHFLSNDELETILCEEKEKDSTLQNSGAFNITR